MDILCFKKLNKLLQIFHEHDYIKKSLLLIVKHIQKTVCRYIQNNIVSRLIF